MTTRQRDGGFSLSVKFISMDEENLSYLGSSCSFLCRLCCTTIEQRKHRYLVQGKNSFNVAVEIQIGKSLPVGYLPLVH